MLPKLFTVKDGVLIPSEHCLALKSLKAIIDTFPKTYLKIYLYIYYMTCWDPENNPFFNLPEDQKEEVILKETGIDFSIDNPVITEAYDLCYKVYDTPTKRAYEGMKVMMDNLAKFMKSQQFTTGRDGSLTAMVSAGEKYHKLRESFKGVEKDYLEEIKNRTRGDRYKGYDQ